MPTPQKAEKIENIRKNFEESAGIYFTRYTGMSVAQATDLRDRFREKDVLYNVSKNTLTRIGAQQAGFDNIEDLLTGQISIAFGKEDPSEPARVIKEFIKKGGSLEVMGILFEGERFEADRFDQLALLPSRNELIAKFINGLSQPMTKLASTLSGAMSKLVRTIDSVKNIKA